MWNSLPRFTKVTVAPRATLSSFGAKDQSWGLPAGSTTCTSFGRAGCGAAAPAHAHVAARAAHATRRSMKGGIMPVIRAAALFGCVAADAAQGDIGQRRASRPILTYPYTRLARETLTA